MYRPVLIDLIETYGYAIRSKFGMRRLNGRYFVIFKYSICNEKAELKTGADYRVISR